MKRHLVLVFVLGVCFTQTISAQPNPAPTSQAPTVARTITPSTTETSPESDNNANSSMQGRSIGTTLAALGAILLLFLGLVQIWRRQNPQVSQSLPETAWEVLGSAPLDQKYQMTIVRVGARLLVLGKSDQGLQTLSEITLCGYHWFGSRKITAHLWFDMVAEPGCDVSIQRTADA